MASRQSKSFDFGKGPRKSIPVDCHGLSGTGRLCSKPLGLLLASLDAVQEPHNMQNDSMS